MSEVDLNIDVPRAAALLAGEYFEAAGTAIAASPRRGRTVPSAPARSRKERVDTGSDRRADASLGDLLVPVVRCGDDRRVVPVLQPCVECSAPGNGVRLSVVHAGREAGQELLGVLLPEVRQDEIESVSGLLGAGMWRLPQLNRSKNRPSFSRTVRFFSLWPPS